MLLIDRGLVLALVAAAAAAGDKSEDDDGDKAAPPADDDDIVVGNECAMTDELILLCFIVVGRLCLPAEDDKDPNNALSPSNIELDPILMGLDDDDDDDPPPP